MDSPLVILNMELDQAATSSLVWALQHGVEILELWGRVRLHIKTLLEWDGRGEWGWVKCYDDTADTYREEMETWAVRVNWDVFELEFGNSFMIKRKGTLPPFP